MSTGIHAAVEIRRAGPVSNASWWLAANFVYVDEPANRVLFAILAGEPTILNIEPIAPMRGLPSDVTPRVRSTYEEWGPVATGVSWVTPSELALGIQRMEAAGDTIPESEREKELFRRNQIGVSSRAVLAFLSAYEANGYHARLLFWFTDI
jgi:hypothetical protein